jgi:type II secretory pathway component PulM
LEEKKQELIYMAVFAALLLLAGYFVLYRPLQRDVKVLRGQMEFFGKQAAKKKELEKQMQESQVKRPRLDSPEEFLRNINDVGRDSDVLIRRISPSKDSETEFDIEIVSDYRAFLKFISSLEGLNVDLKNMSVRQSGKFSAIPRQIVKFTVVPLGGGSFTADERLTELALAVNNVKLRNPFQRSISITNPVVDYTQIIDLTGIHNLTSVSTNEEGVRDAVIDRKVMRVGDSLPPGGKRRISRIEPSGVYLQDDGGGQEYVIKFRKKPGQTTREGKT